ncbi:MAG: FMN-binding protein [Planctomycetota bacterium]|nr:FMN-binding protein [Planctomycetota bacterium]
MSRLPRCALGSLLLACCLGLASSPAARAEDTLEMLSGMKLRGQVVKESDSAIEFLASGAQMSFEKSKIHAVTVSGQRRVLNALGPKLDPPKPAAKPPAPEPAAPPKPAAPPRPEPQAAPAEKGKDAKSRAEVLALIEQAGRAAPPWWEQVQLNYPNSLDLSWPAKAQGGWNNQKNVGQYLWDIVNPNPSKWQQGVRLITHLMTTNSNDQDLVQRGMRTLGGMYHNLLRDYARAAFWWQKAGVSHEGLADCYFRLGCKDLAVEILNKEGADRTRHGEVIKLWADLGELETALKLAEGKAAAGQADIAYLAAGDACRLAGRYPEALAYYQKSLSATQVTRDNKQTKERAQSSLDAVKVFELLDLKRIPDGAYTDTSSSYSGPLTVAVSVQGARIKDVKITSHQDKQFYGSLDEIPAKIVEKQGVKGVDTFSSATITSEAIINAAAKALAKAMK